MTKQRGEESVLVSAVRSLGSTQTTAPLGFSTEWLPHRWLVYEMSPQACLWGLGPTWTDGAKPQDLSSPNRRVSVSSPSSLTFQVLWKVHKLKNFVSGPLTFCSGADFSSWGPQQWLKLQPTLPPHSTCPSPCLSFFPKLLPSYSIRSVQK